MLKNPFILAFFFFGILGVLLVTRQLDSPKIFQPKANVVGVTLSLVPSQISLESGQETTFDLSLNSDQEEVTAIELHLAFDSSKIEVVDIMPTELLPQVLAKELKTPTGSSVILLSAPGSSPEETGIAARVKIKALQNGKTILKIDNNTKVSAVGKTGDVLGAVEPSEITIGGADWVTGQASSSAQIPAAIPATTENANDVIKEFIALESTSAAETAAEGNFITKSVNTASNYFKGIISNINTSLENQASKLFE